MSIEDKLMEYLEEEKRDAGTNIDLKKFRDRAFDKEEVDGALKFKMERHKPALGSYYIPGTAMPAYIESTYQYIFDPVEKSIAGDCLGKTLVIESFSGLAEMIMHDFDMGFELDENDNVILESSYACIERPVSSFEQAFNVICKEIDDMDFKIAFETYADQGIEISEDTFDNLRDACKEYARGLLTEEWNNLQEELEE